MVSAVIFYAIIFTSWYHKYQTHISLAFFPPLLFCCTVENRPYCAFGLFLFKELELGQFLTSKHTQVVHIYFYEVSLLIFQVNRKQSQHYKFSAFLEVLILFKKIIIMIAWCALLLFHPCHRFLWFCLMPKGREGGRVR